MFEEKTGSKEQLQISPFPPDGLRYQGFYKEDLLRISRLGLNQEQLNNLLKFNLCGINLDINEDRDFFANVGILSAAQQNQKLSEQVKLCLKGIEGAKSLDDIQQLETLELSHFFKRFKEANPQAHEAPLVFYQYALIREFRLIMKQALRLEGQKSNAFLDTTKENRAFSVAKKSLAELLNGPQENGLTTPIGKKSRKKKEFIGSQNLLDSQISYPREIFMEQIKVLKSGGAMNIALMNPSLKKIEFRSEIGLIQDSQSSEAVASAESESLKVLSFDQAIALQEIDRILFRRKGKADIRITKGGGKTKINEVISKAIQKANESQGSEIKVINVDLINGLEKLEELKKEEDLSSHLIQLDESYFYAHFLGNSEIERSKLIKDLTKKGAMVVTYGASESLDKIEIEIERIKAKINRIQQDLANNPRDTSLLLNSIQKFREKYRYKPKNPESEKYWDTASNEVVKFQGREKDLLKELADLVIKSQIIEKTEIERLEVLLRKEGFNAVTPYQEVYKFLSQNLERIESIAEKFDSKKLEESLQKYDQKLRDRQQQRLDLIKRRERTQKEFEAADILIEITDEELPSNNANLKDDQNESLIGKIPLEMAGLADGQKMQYILMDFEINQRNQPLEEDLEQIANRCNADIIILPYYENKTTSYRIFKKNKVVELDDDISDLTEPTYYVEKSSVNTHEVTSAEESPNCKIFKTREELNEFLEENGNSKILSFFDANNYIGGDYGSASLGITHQYIQVHHLEGLTWNTLMQANRDRTAIEFDQQDSVSRFIIIERSQSEANQIGDRDSLKAIIDLNTRQDDLAHAVGYLEAKIADLNSQKGEDELQKGLYAKILEELRQKFQPYLDQEVTQVLEEKSENNNRWNNYEFENNFNVTGDEQTVFSAQDSISTKSYLTKYFDLSSTSSATFKIGGNLPSQPNIEIPAKNAESSSKEITGIEKLQKTTEIENPRVETILAQNPTQKKESEEGSVEKNNKSVVNPEDLKQKNDDSERKIELKKEIRKAAKEIYQVCKQNEELKERLSKADSNYINFDTTAYGRKNDLVVYLQNGQNDEKKYNYAIYISGIEAKAPKIYNQKSELDSLDRLEKTALFLSSLLPIVAEYVKKPEVESQQISEQLELTEKDKLESKNLDQDEEVYEVEEVQEMANDKSQSENIVVSNNPKIFKEWLLYWMWEKAEAKLDESISYKKISESDFVIIKDGIEYNSSSAEYAKLPDDVIMEIYKKFEKFLLAEYKYEEDIKILFERLIPQIGSSLQIGEYSLKRQTDEEGRNIVKISKGSEEYTFGDESSLKPSLEFLDQAISEFRAYDQEKVITQLKHDEIYPNSNAIDTANSHSYDWFSVFILETMSLIEATSLEIDDIKYEKTSDSKLIIIKEGKEYEFDGERYPSFSEEQITELYDRFNNFLITQYGYENEVINLYSSLIKEEGEELKVGDYNLKITSDSSGEIIFRITGCEGNREQVFEYKESDKLSRKPDLNAFACIIEQLREKTNSSPNIEDAETKESDELSISYSDSHQDLIIRQKFIESLVEIKRLAKSDFNDEKNSYYRGIHISDEEGQNITKFRFTYDIDNKPIYICITYNHDYIDRKNSNKILVEQIGNTEDQTKLLSLNNPICQKILEYLQKAKAIEDSHITDLGKSRDYDGYMKGTYDDEKEDSSFEGDPSIAEKSLLSSRPSKNPEDESKQRKILKEFELKKGQLLNNSLRNSKLRVPSTHITPSVAENLEESQKYSGNSKYSLSDRSSYQDSSVSEDIRIATSLIAEYYHKGSSKSFIPKSSNKNVAQIAVIKLMNPNQKGELFEMATNNEQIFSEIAKIRDAQKTIKIDQKVEELEKEIENRKSNITSTLKLIIGRTIIQAAREADIIGDSRLEPNEDEKEKINKFIKITILNQGNIVQSNRQIDEDIKLLFGHTDNTEDLQKSMIKFSKSFRSNAYAEGLFTANRSSDKLLGISLKALNPDLFLETFSTNKIEKTEGEEQFDRKFNKFLEREEARISSQSRSRGSSR